VTARTAEEYGMKVDVMPKDYTVPALVESMVEYFKIKKADRITG
jgi:uroporphyrinogen-III synthase